jgi:hypothetical protein
MIVGDKWEATSWNRNKRTDTYHKEITQVNQDGSFVILGRAEKSGYTWYEYWNREHQLEKIVYPSTGKTIIKKKPLRNSLDFPLFVGKEWETKYSSLSKGGRFLEYLDIYKVLSYETVKTKAGNFKAFKINRMNNSIESRRGYRSTEWYCPELKRIIKVKNPAFPPSELLSYKLEDAETNISSYVTTNKTFIEIKEPDQVREFGELKYEVSPGDILEVIATKRCRSGSGICWKVRNIKTGELGYVFAERIKKRHRVYEKPTQK